MGEYREVERVEDIEFDTYTYKTNCRRCHREIGLYFNGGELDWRECCGLTYGLEHTRIDFVITERLPGGENDPR